MLADAVVRDILHDVQTCQDGFNPFIHTCVKLSRMCTGGGSWGRWFQQGPPTGGRLFSRAEVRLITTLEVPTVKPGWFHYTGLCWSTTIPSRVWRQQKKKGNNPWLYGSV